MDTELRWPQAVAALHRDGQSFVLVTLLDTRGSTPRDGDGKMVVSAGSVFDSIGGGALEYRVIGLARDMLRAGVADRRLERFTLGPDLDQCCGGRVEVLLECLPASELRIELHGAGHVGRALVHLLGELHCQVRWIDERAQMFPHSVPDNVRTVQVASATAAVVEAPPRAWHLVMTHAHGLDLALCEAVLSRGDARYLGLIGSRSKAVRFRRRLAAMGFSDEELKALHCPVGLPGVGGKAPMEIAVSIVADLLRRRGAAADGRDRRLALVQP